MKKVLALFISVFAISCGTTKSVDKSTVLYEVLTQQSDGGGNIRFFEILSEPNEIKMLLSDESLKGKIDGDDIDKANYIILNMGEKSTGGYSIGVEKVEETDKNIIITVKETAPAPDSMVMQVITYPYAVVKINSKKEIVIK
ncbi:protease complex subunit PrcB family protein [Flavobacterium sp. LS1R47]|uniref:Protease complex subunit PrcB family protein n=1 Tax=Flavobacterium frigoritolerans TaxID=2987686 RepID=A0A9X2Z096_9FLAO|nr:protease complex subunit PrcB family protein [Flavobacterium frigoritolerans]MCV9933213.1 protease complex subunit PrcB family protein [Flavobacterium frigoritolerans]